ncbi:MAG: hypothetical protein ACREQT_10770 [Candidatus Binataceae bacterium]
MPTFKSLLTRLMPAQRLMPWLGGLAILLCAPILMLSQRIYLPIGRQPLTLFAPLIDSTLSAHIDFFNLAVVLLLVIGAAACALRRPAIVAAAGAVLLLLTLVAYLEVAVGRTSSLAQLVREAAWLQHAYAFDFSYMPRNVANEPSLWARFRFDTVWDRMVTGWYFMGFGWNLMLAVGCAIFIPAVRLLEARIRLCAILFTALAGVGLLAFFLWAPLRGQQALVEGALAEARGSPEAALRLYARAAQLDGWLAMDLRLRQRIGGLESSSGHPSTPAARVFEAEALVAQSSAPGAIGELPKAIAIYEELAAENGDLAAAAALRASDLEAAYGLNLFRDGAFGSAIEIWERMLAQDPGMWLAKYYLSRGYFVVGRYQEAASMSRQTLAESSDPRVVADLYSNLGDALIRLREYNDAHQAYFAAYQIDYVGDFRGLDALVGP